MMLDELAQLADRNPRAQDAIAAAARRMWLALAEFERSGYEIANDG